jgi:aryl-alcohol dehydrogenase-like predicted oxidoreductase
MKQINERSIGKITDFRPLGRTGWNVSAIGIGTWAMGPGAWGKVNDKESLAALELALDMGVNFFDTADIYGSEHLLAKLRKKRSEPFYVATKAGRRLRPLTAEGFNRKNLTRFVEDSLRKLKMDSLDLLQLHCPPVEVYSRPEVFGILDDLTSAGKLRFYGVSVTSVDEALTAIRNYPNVQSVQIIFNMFRQKPIGQLFAEAKQHQVGILARVPLASGLLTGKFTASSQFPRNDHRNYNRHGQVFDVGETFSGVDYETGLEAVEKLKQIVPPCASLAQLALKWILMFDAVTCAIPGAKRPGQVEENVLAATLAPLPAETMTFIQDAYNQYFRLKVQGNW